MWREVLRKCHRGGGGDIIYWGIILRWRGGWIDSLQSTTLCDENTNVIQIHQIQWVTHTHTHTNSTWLESKYNMARFFVLATRSKYCMYISLELCDAEGSEVDTLFMFLWHPMHENDLKSRACSTYSSLSNYQEKKKWWWYKKESLMIYVPVIGKYMRGSKNISGYFCKTPESWMFLLWVLNWFGSILLTDVSTQAECADIPRPIHFKTVWYTANTAQCKYSALHPMSSWNCL